MRQRLQAGEVSAHLRLAFEIDVVCHHIQERQRQILCRRMVHVSRQHARSLLLDDVIEPVEKLLDSRLAIPAHNQRRNFVPDGEQQHRGMAAQTPTMFPGPVVEMLQALRVVEVAPARPPADVRKQKQSCFRRRVREPVGRRRVEADGVDAGLAHLREIGPHLGPWRERLAIRVGPESAIRDALHPEA